MSDEEAFFCDTNILRFLVEHPNKWERLRKYLQENNYRLVFSPIQFIEFKKIPRYHDGLTKLLSSVPSSFTKGSTKILEEEISNYPSSAKIELFHKPSINEIIGKHLGNFGFQLLLDSINAEILWDSMNDMKPKYMDLFSWLPTTLPSASEKIEVDFMLHNFGVVIGELRKVNQEFVKSFRESPNSLKVDYFCGAHVSAAYVYYRYILKGITPEPSDVGDIHQVFYFPYCREIVTEKSMSSIIYQLKRERDIMANTSVKTIRFIRSL